MTTSDESKWQDLIARRPLTDSEQAEFEAWLARDPAARDRWQSELRLTHALRRLPPPDVPSNFVARVMAEIQHPSGARPRSSWLRWWTDWRHALPLATALGAMVLTLAIQARQRAHLRTEVAEGLTALPLEGLSQIQFWQDFEPIQGLPQGPLPSGRELAAAFE